MLPRFAWLLNSRFRILAPSFRLLAPGSWLLAPGSWLLAPGREHARRRLRFLVVGPSSFGGLFRSGKSSGLDWTVAAGFWLLASSF
jgi:hypothetical protein